MKLDDSKIHILETGDKIIKRFPGGEFTARMELNSEIEDFRLTFSGDHITITKVDNTEKTTRIEMRINKFIELIELFNIVTKLKNNESKNT